MATIRKLPSGRYQVQVRRKGLSASSTFATLKAARRWAREQEGRVDQAQTQQGRIESVQFDELLDIYETETMPRKRGSSQESYRLPILRKYFRGKALSAVTTHLVQSYAVARLDAGIGSDTIRRELSLLSAIFQDAEHRLAVDRLNPVPAAQKALTQRGLIHPKVRRVRRLYPGEYRKLLTHSNPTLRWVIRLVLETALRRSEIIRLRPTHLRPDGLWVEGDKTGSKGVIPLTAKARRMIESMPSEGLGMRADSITQAFGRACKRAGVTDLREHDLRHEATSRLFEKGLSIQEVALITRHRNWATLQIYTHPRAADVSRKLGAKAVSTRPKAGHAEPASE